MENNINSKKNLEPNSIVKGLITAEEDIKKYTYSKEIYRLERSNASFCVLCNDCFVFFLDHKEGTLPLYTIIGRDLPEELFRAQGKKVECLQLGKWVSYPNAAFPRHLRELECEFIKIAEMYDKHNVVSEIMNLQANEIRSNGIKR